MQGYINYCFTPAIFLPSLKKMVETILFRSSSHARLPISIIDRTFSSIFCFELKSMKRERSLCYYRNPICIAKEYNKMIKTGEVKNQSVLARKLGVSRVRVSQVLSLLKLDRKIIEAIEKLGNPMPARIITERMLREYIKHPESYHEYIH